MVNVRMSRVEIYNDGRHPQSHPTLPKMYSLVVYSLVVSCSHLELAIVHYTAMV